MSEMQQKWDRRYRTALGVKPEDAEPEAAVVLREFSHLLPGSGAALDLACGLGANALWLARAGLQVQAWDFSPVAIDALAARAERENLALQAAVRDVVATPPTSESFDVIVVSYFLGRALAPHLQAALRPGGLLFYQTFVQDKVADAGPNNPDFLLAENELLSLFPKLTVRVFRDEGITGNTKKGLRNETLFIGQLKAGQN